MLLSPSRMLCGPSLPKTVTALASALEAARDVEGRPRIRLGVLGEAGGELGRRALRRAVASTRLCAADVEQHEPDRATDRGVRGEGRPEAAAARVDAQLARDRSAHHDRLGDRVRRRVQPGDVVRLLEDRLHRREHDGEDARLAAGHRRIRGDALDGDEAVTGRQHAEHIEGVTVAALDQRLDQRRRGRDDRQPVRPAARDHRLVQRARLRGQREPFGGLAAGGDGGGRSALVGSAIAVGRRQQPLDLGHGGRGEAVDGRGRDAAERVRHGDIR